MDSGGRAKKLLLVWPSSERGIWYARATKEDGAGGRAVSGGKWCAANDGEERRKKKRGGRRREEEEEWKTGKKVHQISILLLLPGYTVLRSVNSYTDDMWVYHKRAHMSVNKG